MTNQSYFDLIVIGAGHAGCESALAAARMGRRTLLVTLDLDAVAFMACNPSIGGTAKGQLVREIDALGGEMGVNADKALLQIKMLNRGKGAAVYSLRGQEDKHLYHRLMLSTLKSQPNLTLVVGEVAKILTDETSDCSCDGNGDNAEISETASKNGIETAKDGETARKTDDTEFGFTQIARKTADGVSKNGGKADKNNNTEYLSAQSAEKVRSVRGVTLVGGRTYYAKAAVIATGVYLCARTITGDEIHQNGPSGFAAATELTASLKELNLDIRRFKTGTPARVARDSVDFSKMSRQDGEDIDCFSFLTDERLNEQTPCYLTYTNEETHRIIRANIARSPLFNGTIAGVGPRYCPSIEDKVMRFADKPRHQVFIEPESAESDELYVQGMSSSLPKDVQEAMYHTLSGLENVRILRYAYAIEYDCINPLELSSSLMTKRVKGLFSAGQMNGSSGYEEAAAQGLIAGINAARYSVGLPPYIPTRDTSYIGVLIDDLVTKGTNEPYRMMTARAEHRIYLRQDNADLRLTAVGHDLRLVGEERYQRMLRRKSQIEAFKSALTVCPPRKAAEELLISLDESVPNNAITFGDLVRRPCVREEDVRGFLSAICDSGEPWSSLSAISDRDLESAVIETKYDGYLKKEEQAAAEQRRLEQRELPEDIDYLALKGLRTEARLKLDKIRPKNLGQASRVSGVSPADVAVLILYLKLREFE